MEQHTHTHTHTYISSSSHLTTTTTTRILFLYVIQNLTHRSILRNSSKTVVVKREQNNRTKEREPTSCHQSHTSWLHILENYTQYTIKLYMNEISLAI